MGKYFEKDASYRFFRDAAKAVKESLLGTRNLKVPEGVMHAERTKAKEVFEKVISPLNPFRARIKSPQSIEGHLVQKPNEPIVDIAGAQIYERTNPRNKVEEIKSKLIGAGAEEVKVNKLDRPGYVGANISGIIEGIGTEIQLTPGVRANLGQLIQHNSYKVPEGYTSWDIDTADRVGKRLINWGTKSKPEWAEFLGRAPKS